VIQGALYISQTPKPKGRIVVEVDSRTTYINAQLTHGDLTNRNLQCAVQPRSPEKGLPYMRKNASIC